MSVLSLWIKTYGVPQALYCDKKNAFALTREPTDTEVLKGIIKPKSKVAVRVRLDGSVFIVWKGKQLLVEEIHLDTNGHAARPAA